MSNFRSVPGMLIVSVFGSWTQSARRTASACMSATGPLVLGLLLAGLGDRVLAVGIRLDGRVALGAREFVDAGAGLPVRLGELVEGDGLARMDRHAAHRGHEAGLHAARDLVVGRVVADRVHQV